MWYEVELTIPAGTLKSAPVKVDIDVTVGIVHHVVIEAAPGCHREASIRVYYQNDQIYPSNPDNDIALDGVPREFDDRLEIFEDPLIIRVVGYAPNAKYDHTYRIAFGIMPPDAFIEYNVQGGLIKRMAQLLGVLK